MESALAEAAVLDPAKVAVLAQAEAAISVVAIEMTAAVVPAAAVEATTTEIFSGKEVSSKARVLSKPEPQYTEEARKNQITGTVVLRAVFTSGGQVTNIRSVSGLPFGLTERAIAAARQIKFSPATKDGRPVSMYIQLEYNFNLY